MSYSLQALPNGKFELRLSGVPAHCHPLPMAPACREAELSRGTWLVLLFAVWSMLDVRAIDTALALAKKREGRIQLGLRPFDDENEVRSWCPEATAHATSQGLPAQWLVLRDGRLVSALPLMTPASEILTAIDQAIPAAPATKVDPIAIPVAQARN